MPIPDEARTELSEKYPKTRLTMEVPQGDYLAALVRENVEWYGKKRLRFKELLADGTVLKGKVDISGGCCRGLVCNWLHFREVDPKCEYRKMSPLAWMQLGRHTHFSGAIEIHIRTALSKQITDLAATMRFPDKDASQADRNTHIINNQKIQEQVAVLLKEQSVYVAATDRNIGGGIDRNKTALPPNTPLEAVFRSPRDVLGPGKHNLGPPGHAIAFDIPTDVNEPLYFYDPNSGEWQVDPVDAQNGFFVTYWKHFKTPGPEHPTVIRV